MSISKTLISQISRAKEKGWDKIYMAVDLHGTVIKPLYDDNNTVEYYPWSKGCLTYLSNDPRFCLILYTCSHPDQIEDYLNKFREDGINFEYVNENPEVESDGEKYGYYEQKFYRNLTLDDTAGFNPSHDWCALSMLLPQLPTL